MNVVEIIKASVGVLLVLLLCWLAWHIIHGDVTQANSFGLDAVFTIVGGLGTAYAMWAYRYRGNGNGGEK